HNGRPLIVVRVPRIPRNEVAVSRIKVPLQILGAAGAACGPGRVKGEICIRAAELRSDRVWLSVSKAGRRMENPAVVRTRTTICKVLPVERSSYCGYQC